MTTVPIPLRPGHILQTQLSCKLSGTPGTHVVVTKRLSGADQAIIGPKEYYTPFTHVTQHLLGLGS